MSDSIQNGKVVAFAYTLKDSDGNILEQTQGSDAIEYIHGNQNIIPGLEQAMLGMKVGEMKNVKVKAEDAYGLFDDDLLFKVPLSNFPADKKIEPGMEFQTNSENGVMVITVREIDGDNAIVDGNHPMAGLDLEFDVTVKNIREATAQEKAHGHVHQHGHDH
jgi:FKBP-type peptidyl-prolyl cis-trans isomerase SlyD